MGRINRTTMDALRKLFSQSNDRKCHQSSSNINDSLNYLDNNVFNLFLHIDCAGPHIVVPLFCRGYIERIICGRLDVTEVDIALFANGFPSERRTSNAMFKLFTEISFSQRLIKVTTSKGETYYGGYGMILDRDMNPIFFCTLEGEVTGEGLTYNSAKIYVNPSVLLTEGILEKGIIKTIIPAYVEKGVSIYTRFSNINRRFKKKDDMVIPEVVIKDFTDDFFVRPSKPKPSTFTRDKVNGFLLEHVDDIKSMAHL